MCFKRNIYRILAFLAILQPLVTCPGCSVKEDRASCPCLLTVLSQKAEGLDSSIVMTASGFTGKASGFVLDEVLDMSPAEKDGTLKWSWKVPRGKMYVNAVSPSVQANATELHKPWVKVEPGDEFPSLWTFSVKSPQTVSMLRFRSGCIRTIVALRSLLGICQGPLLTFH